MDLVAFEELALRGDLSEAAPGEGVAVLLLKRLEDARRDGDRVQAVLRQRAAAFVPGQPGVALARALAGVPAPQAFDAGLEREAAALASAFPAARRREPLASRIGHLGPAHGLAAVVRATLEGGDAVITSSARAGLAAQVVVEPIRREARPAAAPRVMLRLAAPTLQELASELRAASVDLARAVAACPAELPPGRFALVAVAADEAELAAALEVAVRHIGDGALAALDEHGIFVRERRAVPSRIAWLLPGQGSQYPDMLARLLADSPAARDVHARAEAALRGAGPELTRSDAVATQVGMLVADLCFAAAAREAGLRCDVLAGHSYGELPALVHAGVLDLESALELTLVRARAVAAAPVAGGLLTVAADAGRVQEWLGEFAGEELWITHFNAPRQTVVGGATPLLQRFQERLTARGVASRSLAVAGALHTPLVASAGEAVREALRGLPLQPPRTPVCSNVSLRYEAEPASVRENLAAQLTEPLRYVDLVERLHADGCRLLIEVGPGQVLTGLHRQILAERDVALLALDHPRRPPTAQLARALALAECLGVAPQLPAARPALPSPVPPGEIEEFDATRARRRRARRRASARQPAADTRSTGPAAPRSGLERFVVDFVVEHTGYPSEVVRLDWDLEADLGIDSIKRAQLLGELGELVGLDDARTRALGSATNLGELVARAEEAAREVGSPLAPAAARAPAPAPKKPEAAPAPPPALPAAVTGRYVVRVEPAPRRAGLPDQPRLRGGVVVLGGAPLAAALRERCAAQGVPVHALPSSPDESATVAAFDAIWKAGPVPHLVLATARDADPGLPADWSDRRARGVTAPFWLAQRWLARVREADLADDASLTAVVAMGGAFGSAGGAIAVESGGLSGLLKAISIETWVAGLRGLAVRVLDAPAHERPDRLAELVLLEMAAPSHELEVAWSGQERGVVRVVPEPVAPVTDRGPRPGGTWVCTGGARGITARIARELGERYGLRLHLLGHSPTPELPEAWRGRERHALRLEVMADAHARGRNAVREWQAVEKALEIDATLRELAGAGIVARYHCCDVGDAAAVRRTLEVVRRLDGPIEGVVHGAGYGRDARFEDKRPERVERCLAAKVDGAIALLQATRADPLRHFVALGSISGRFGANGHTDYSLANDLLAKLMVAARHERPGLAATAFHWHAWDDAGMATRPETRLALEMAGVRLMPAREGIGHLVAELEAGLPAAEVVITDERHPRLFQPVPEAHSQAAMLSQATRVEAGGELRFAVRLDPALEPMLQDHRLDGEPLLPLVAGLELMAEAAVLAGAAPQLQIRDAEALHALRFPLGRPREVTVRVSRCGDGAFDCAVLVDVHGPDGRCLEAGRVVMKAKVAGGEGPVRPGPGPDGERWEAVAYPGAEAPFQLGPRLRALRRVCLQDEAILGRISAPAPRELGGPHRGSLGWQLSCGALDACFYAVGVLAWRGVRPGVALPSALESLWLGRLPDPGEACRVSARLRHGGPARARFDFELWGANGECLASATGYEVTWRAVPAPASAMEVGAK
jgi:malonyl CoA-acyl carrier protein transacylase